MREEQTVREAARYVFSSVLSAGADFSAYYLLSRFAFAGEISLCYFLARVVSASLNFVLNEKFVFRRGGKGRGGRILKYGALVAAVAVLSHGAQLAINGMEQIDDMAAKLAADLLMFILSYLLQKLFVFRKSVKKT